MAKSFKRKIIDFTREEEEQLIELIKNRPAIYDFQHEFYKNAQFRNKQWVEISKTVKKSVSDCKTRWRSLRDTYKKKRTKTSCTGVPEKWELLDLLAFLENSNCQNSSLVNAGEDESIHIIPNFDEPQYLQSDNDEAENQQEALTAEHQQNYVPQDSFQNFQEDYLKYSQQDENILKNPKIKQTRTLQSCRSGSTILKRDKLIDELKASREERLKILRTLCVSAKEHPIEVLFKGLAQTVMTFPPNLAAEAKFRVCQIVSELECRLHNVTSPLTGNLGCSLSPIPNIKK